MKYFFAWLAVTFSLAVFNPANAQEDDYLTEWKAKCIPLLAEWRKAEARNNTDLRDRLIEAAVRSEQSEIVDEVAAGGDVASLEIKLPAEARKIVAKTVRRFEEIPTVPYGSQMDCVIRRMTKTRLEAWTPKTGWLFDAKGRVLNEALPPRRDGFGREWHGAFLPDGSWITTDLWEMDKTLTFFSRKGKWLKDIKVAELAPAGPDEHWGLNLIGWARCDQQGEGWVVSVGDGPGRAQVFVKPQGKPRLLEDGNAVWKLCYPRDVEPKGMFTGLDRPSDDCKVLIHFSCPAHGMWVGYPTYTWGEKENGGKIISGGDHNFGFLPGSHDVFVGASDCDNGDGTDRRHLKTWFFTVDGKCRGWIRAAYLTDSPDGKATWYADDEGCVVVIGADLKLQDRMHFVIEGENATPVKLFTDLSLGFFCLGKRLVLASW